MIKKTFEINCKKLFFDFDGVIVDSNKFKEKAIFESIQQTNILNFDTSKAILFFNQNAGIGRRKKLSKFFNKETVDEILFHYSEKCLKFFSKARPTPGCKEFISLVKKKFPHIEIFILSGGSFNEISKFLKVNNMNNIFDKILCDNKSKKQHLIDEKADLKDIFFGDSKGDIKTAMSHPLVFILVKRFSSKISKPNYEEEKNAKFSIDTFLNIDLKV